MTALGIIVAERVTNSFDHAFPTGGGEILVLARRTELTTAALTIRDDGSGFSPDAGSKRHGLGLVRRLAEQLRGTIAMALDGATMWTIDFPALPVGEIVHARH